MSLRLARSLSAAHNSAAACPAATMLPQLELSHSSICTANPV